MLDKIKLNVLLLCLTTIWSCGENVKQANLKNLVSEEVNQEIERLEAQQAGGKMRRRFKALQSHNLSLKADTHLQLKIEKVPASLEIAPQLINLPSNWYDFETLAIELRSNQEVSFHLSAVHINGLLSVAVNLPPDETTMVELSLRDLPLASANESPYTPMGIRLEFLSTSGNSSPEIAIKKLFLRTASNKYERTCVDRYGQRITNVWEGKVLNDQDLAEDRYWEDANLEAITPKGRSRFGGWKEGPLHQSTGFFRVEQTENGIWWLIDPDGYRFWSTGITCVNIGRDVTATAGREFLYQDFDNLPLKNDEQKSINYFALNVERKYDSLEQWRQRTLDRLISWGINTIGNWSNPAMMRPGKIVYTTNLSTRSTQAPMAAHRLPNVFDVRWEQWFDSTVAMQVAAYRNDPWLLGYFVDNELPWLHLNLLDAGEEMAVKIAWQQFVQNATGGLDSVQDIWPKIQNWDDLLRLQERDAESGAAAQLKNAFEAHFAETYFAKVARILKRHDPNHLYLGCRFVRNAPHKEIVAAAGRFCDVITVNCYSWEPEEKQFGDWYTTCGRPILIGEHHVTLKSNRQVPPPWKVFDASERELYYKNFVEVWSKRPYSLGCHYFQLIDQPLTGRFDGENRTIGWLDITDQPHQDLVRAARASLPYIYQWHAGIPIKGK